MELKGPGVKQFFSAMEASFDPDGVDRLLNERWNIGLHKVTSTKLRFDAQLTDLLRYFNQRNMTEELIIAARDARPRNPVFVALADQCGFANLPSGLQAFIRPSQTAPAHAKDFRVRLSLLENHVCRVEVAGIARGTGVLVGPNLVLTNYHVVPDIEKAGEHRVSCLFDYKKGADNYISPARRVTVLRALAWSKPAPEDSVADGIATDPQALDYALLELEEPVGAEALVASFDLRGHARIPPDPKLAADSGILILQHPQAQPLKVDLGAVTQVIGTRVRHNVSTSEGSSGAPVYDADLALVALHNAGYGAPVVAFPYNLAIPMSLIVTDLRAKQITLAA